MTRRFSASEATIWRDLQSTLSRMGANSLRVGQDFDRGEYEISFDRGGRRYVVRCDRWKHPLDNFRAAQRSISLLYSALEEYGVAATDSAMGTSEDPFVQFFAGFEALPADRVLAIGSGAWWDVLSVPRAAKRADVESAFRALAKVHHPDVGGDAESFKRIRAAYEQGIAATR